MLDIGHKYCQILANIAFSYLFYFSPVAPNITSPHPTTLTLNEKQTAQLMCTATGRPTPSINWTRNGEVVGKGSPFNITAKLEDHNQCYTCVAYNGVSDAMTANVCLVVQCKYRSALGYPYFLS